MKRNRPLFETASSSILRVTETIHIVLQGVVKWFLVTLISVMAVLIVIQAVLRYGFGFSFTWVPEFLRFAMAWLVFVGASAAVRNNELIGFDFLVDRLSKRAQHGLGLVKDLIVVVFLGWIVVQGSRMAGGNMDQLSTSLRIPMGIP